MSKIELSRADTVVRVKARPGLQSSAARNLEFNSNLFDRQQRYIEKRCHVSPERAALIAALCFREAA